MRFTINRSMEKERQEYINLWLSIENDFINQADIGNNDLERIVRYDRSKKPYPYSFPGDSASHGWIINGTVLSFIDVGTICDK